MSKTEIGPLRLLLPSHAGRRLDITDFSGEAHVAEESAGLVVGPRGVLLEVAYQRWDGGGKVVMLGRGDSPPAFDRLMHGERLGIKPNADGTEFVEVDLLHWDHAKQWGGSKMATPAELDRVLGSSAEALLVEVGALAFGSRAAVLGDSSNRRNRLCATFPATEPTGALTVYALTRVLPIVEAMS